MTNPRQRRRRRRRRVSLGLLLCIGIPLGGWALWRYHGPAEPREIFQGITYGCQRMPDSEQSGGLLHWVRADLNVPGVSLFVTPMDPQAQAVGLEYRLQHTSTLVANQGLAAAVNGTLFSSDSGFVRLPGDLARTTETVVSNHVVNHVDKNSYLLWWDDQNVAHLETQKPPGDAVLARAKWAVGGQSPDLFPGSISNNWSVECRTAIGANPQKKLVWICTFDKASYHFVSQWLFDQGATIGIVVDGGTSTAMAIGSAAKNVRPGTVTGNWRPVATHFGFFAKPLP